MFRHMMWHFNASIHLPGHSLQTLRVDLALPLLVYLGFLSCLSYLSYVQILQIVTDDYWVNAFWSMHIYSFHLYLLTQWVFVCMFRGKGHCLTLSTKQSDNLKKSKFSLLPLVCTSLLWTSSTHAHLIL